jgi:hypothetical protein
MRPVISDEMLARAGVQHVSADEAKALCGLDSSGLWLPYRYADGSVIRDGTNVHAYLPPTVADAASEGGDLCIIEGEFKSLAQTEAGFAAVGISGFFGFAVKGGEELVPELVALIQRRKPARVLFCGDSDTALNYQFTFAAVRLAKLLPGVPVWLPSIPLDGPGKGADDCRAKLNGSFADWWRERITNAIEVKTDADAKLMMMELL